MVQLRAQTEHLSKRSQPAPSPGTEVGETGQGQSVLAGLDAGQQLLEAVERQAILALNGDDGAQVAAVEVAEEGAAREEEEQEAFARAQRCAIWQIGHLNF